MVEMLQFTKLVSLVYLYKTCAFSPFTCHSALRRKHSVQILRNSNNHLPNFFFLSSLNVLILVLKKIFYSLQQMAFVTTFSSHML